jgi:hypothetical protein
VGWRAWLAAIPLAAIGAEAVVLLGHYVLGWPASWASAGTVTIVAWAALYIAGLSWLNAARSAAIEEEHGWRRWR